MPLFLIFLLQFIFTNVLFSYLIFCLIEKYVLKNEITGLEFIIFFFSSFSFGPIFVSLILYYSILILPSHSSYFYLFIIGFFAALLTLIVRKELLSSFRKIRTEIATLYNKGQTTVREKLKFFVTDFGLNNTFLKKINTNTPFVIGTIVLFFILFVLLVFLTLTSKSIGNDFSEYLVQGKMFFLQKKINYLDYRYDVNSGFYYVGKHAFAFPLISTWSFLFNDFFNTNFDLYFKSVSTYYCFLLFLFCYAVALKMGKNHAVLFFILLLFNYTFIRVLMPLHIDSMRILFITITIYYFALCIKNKKIQYLFLFSIFAGLSSYTHSIGFIFSLVLLMSFFIFSEMKLFKKIYYSLFSLVLIVLFGGLHYILDILLGSGWVFLNE